MRPSSRLPRFYLNTGWSIISVGLGVLRFAARTTLTGRRRRRLTKTSSGSTVSFVTFTKTPSD